mmetsp:Transcript_82805/g.230926  ORF Transcript_82805/g.230926 Transcript_82805/m.230926 type:complete len:104 (+) Transcript_82805:1106-1417(+)
MAKRRIRMLMFGLARIVPSLQVLHLTEMPLHKQARILPRARHGATRVRLAVIRAAPEVWERPNLAMNLTNADHTLLTVEEPQVEYQKAEQRREMLMSLLELVA